jgi:hypothetical protein
MTDGQENSVSLKELQDRKRELYIQKQIKYANWSESDEEAYKIQIKELNEKISVATKQQFNSSALKAEIESEIEKILEKVKNRSNT